MCDWCLIMLWWLCVGVCVVVCCGVLCFLVFVCVSCVWFCDVVVVVCCVWYSGFV